MSRSSIAIWRSARELSSDKQVVGIPECPPYLSEPAYANLAFDAHCHVRITSYGPAVMGAFFLIAFLTLLMPQSCLANNIHEIMWEFVKRYCTKCKGFVM
jgi:hypothetical protein